MIRLENVTYHCEGGPWACGRSITGEQAGDRVIDASPTRSVPARVFVPGGGGVYCVHQEPNGEHTWWEMRRRVDG